MSASIVTPEAIAAATVRRDTALRRRGRYRYRANTARDTAAVTAGLSMLGFGGDWLLSKFKHVPPTGPDVRLDDPSWRLDNWDIYSPTLSEDLAELFSGVAMLIGYVAGSIAVVALVLTLVMLLAARCIRIPAVPADPHAVWDTITELTRANRASILERLPAEVRATFPPP